MAVLLTCVTDHAMEDHIWKHDARSNLVGPARLQCGVCCVSDLESRLFSEG